MSRLRLGATVLLLLAASACGPRDSDEELEAPAGPAWPLPAGVTVRLDPRVELLTAVQALAGDAPAERFAAQREHPAVRRYKAWRAAGVPAAAPMQALLLATSAYVLAEPPESDGWATGQLGGPDAVRAFVAELRDFDRAAGFGAYFLSRSSENAVAAAEAVAEIRRGVPVASLEDYLGARFKGRYELIPAPGYRGSGTVMAIRSRPGFTTQVRFRSARPGAPYQLARTGNSLAHELAHQIVRPPRDAGARLEAGLGPPPASCSGGAAGGGWANCLDEHVVMGVEIRLSGREPKFEAGAFPYLPAVLDALKEYEGNRARFPNLESYYPRLVDAVIRGSKGR